MWEIANGVYQEGPAARPATYPQVIPAAICRREFAEFKNQLLNTVSYILSNVLLLSDCASSTLSALRFITGTTES